MVFLSLAVNLLAAIGTIGLALFAYKALKASNATAARITETLASITEATRATAEANDRTAEATSVTAEAMKATFQATKATAEANSRTAQAQTNLYAVEQRHAEDEKLVAFSDAIPIVLDLQMGLIPLPYLNEPAATISIGSLSWDSDTLHELARRIVRHSGADGLETVSRLRLTLHALRKSFVVRPAVGGPFELDVWDWGRWNNLLSESRGLLHEIRYRHLRYTGVSPISTHRDTWGCLLAVEEIMNASISPVGDEYLRFETHLTAGHEMAARGYLKDGGYRSAWHSEGAQWIMDIGDDTPEYMSNDLLAMFRWKHAHRVPAWTPINEFYSSEKALEWDRLAATE